MVTNAEEDGTVTLSAQQPKVGVALTASVTDPDGTPTEGYLGSGAGQRFNDRRATDNNDLEEECHRGRHDDDLHPDQ